MENTKLYSWKELKEKVDFDNQKYLIINDLEEKKPEENFEFLQSYLKEINNLDRYINISDKIKEEDYWPDKKGYDLYKYTIDYYNENLNDEDKFSLFLKGYLLSFPKNYVLANLNKLTRKEIEKVLEVKLLSEEETFGLIDNVLKDELREISEVNAPHELYWLFSTAKKHLTEIKFRELEKSLSSDASDKLIYGLWKNGYIDYFPKEYVINEIFTKPNFQKEIDKWLNENLFTKEELKDFLLEFISNLQQITNRNEFYILFNSLKNLNDFGADLYEIQTNIQNYNIEFIKLASWIQGLSGKFDYEIFKNKLVFLKPEHQVLFVKKMFALAQKEEFDLTVAKLEELIDIDFGIFELKEEENPVILIDITTEVIIRIIKSFAETGKFFLAIKEMKNVLERDLLNKKEKFQLTGYFEKCKGRCKAKLTANRNGEVKKLNDNWKISFEYDKDLVAEVKKLPNRKYNPEERYWYVPTKNEEAIIKFAKENSFFIDMQGSNYKNNPHLINFIRESSLGIYCEGKLSEVRDCSLNEIFWWCRNEICYKNSETFHEAEDWENYTLLDFLNILNFDINDGIQLDGYTEKKSYYTFIGSINCIFRSKLTPYSGRI
mgnify:FL=1